MTFQKKFFLFLFFLVTFTTNQVLGQAPRVPNSPYPVSKIPQTIYVSQPASDDERLLVQTLAGVVAQNMDSDGTFIYILGDDADDFWLSLIQQDDPNVTVNSQFKTNVQQLGFFCIVFLEYF